MPSADPARLLPWAWAFPAMSLASREASSAPRRPCFIASSPRSLAPTDLSIPAAISTAAAEEEAMPSKRRRSTLAISS